MTSFRVVVERQGERLMKEIPDILVLARKLDQAVAIGGTSEFEHLVKITVLEIKGRSLRLGFEVDSSVPIHRWEVWQRISTSPVSEALVA